MGILKSFGSMNVVDSFNEMLKETNILIDELKGNSSDILIPQQMSILSASPGQTYENSHQKLEVILRDIWYVADEDGRQTRTYQGIVLCDPSIIELVKRLNQSKDEFHQAVKAYTEANGRKSSKEIKNQIVSQLDGRDKLKGVGLQRLNLNACYRKVPFLSESPEKIGYSMQNSSTSISRITVKQARELLKEINEGVPEHIQIQLKKIRNLSEDFVLARVQKQSPIIKANIVFKRLENGELVVTRKTKKPPLPFFILKSGDQVPVVKFLPDGYSGNIRMERIDKRIEDEPLLPSIRVHKYKGT